MKKKKNPQKHREKYFGSRYYLSPIWTIYNQRLHSHHGQQLTSFSVNLQPQTTTVMRSSKDSREWPCITSTSGDALGLDVMRCISISDNITNWPKTTGKTENYKWYFNQSCLIHDINMAWEKLIWKSWIFLVGPFKLNTKFSGPSVEGPINLTDEPCSIWK